MPSHPTPSGPERTQLATFLDQYRATILRKAEGLDAAELARPLPPSSLTLAGLVNHLAYVEDLWFRVRFAGLPADPLWAGIDWRTDPDHEFRTAVDVPGDELRRRYERACARSRDVVVGAESLDRRAAVPRSDGHHADLRWILLHMIEETARHAGHADLIREAIDGTVGA
jgi:uncharacterized damage-inducible protein DinB